MVVMGVTQMDLEDIEAAIEKLSDEEFFELAEWMAAEIEPENEDEPEFEE